MVNLVVNNWVSKFLVFLPIAKNLTTLHLLRRWMFFTNGNLDVPFGEGKGYISGVGVNEVAIMPDGRTIGVDSSYGTSNSSDVRLSGQYGDTVTGSFGDS